MKVTDELIKYIQQRDAIGQERYGASLTTNNGRDALKDALEEALDCAQYIMQAVLERNDMEVQLTRLKALDRLPREVQPTSIHNGVVLREVTENLRNADQNQTPNPEDKLFCGKCLQFDSEFYVYMNGTRYCKDCYVYETGSVQ